MSQSRRCLEARVWPEAEDEDSSSSITDATDHASSLTYFVAGIVAGSAGSFVGHPFETVKLTAQQLVTERRRTWLGRLTVWAKQVARRLLLGTSAVDARPSSLEVAKQLIKEGGVGRLYEGFVSPVTFGGIEKSVRFGVQSTMKDLCVEWPSTPRIVASGLVSGFASALLTTPIDQAKVNRQLRVPSTVSTAYAALPCALANYIFYSPFYFLCYDRLRNTLLPSDLLAGGFTGAVACALFFPFVSTVSPCRVSEQAAAFLGHDQNRRYGARRPDCLRAEAPQIRIPARRHGRYIPRRRQTRFLHRGHTGRASSFPGTCHRLSSLHLVPRQLRSRTTLRLQSSSARSLHSTIVCPFLRFFREVRWRAFSTCSGGSSTIRCSHDVFSIRAQSGWPSPSASDARSNQSLRTAKFVGFYRGRNSKKWRSQRSGDRFVLAAVRQFLGFLFGLAELYL